MVSGRLHPAGWLLGIAAMISILFSAQSSGAKMPNEDYAAIIAFAADFSGNDATIVEKVRQMAANPPTDLETIGFYSGENYPPRERLFLATVNLLANAKKFYSVEDKYSYEIFSIWQDEGIIDGNTLPTVAKTVFAPLFDGNEPSEGKERYQDFVWANYAQATEELEQHIVGRGKVLLSIDATDGDTMFFALVTPDIATRWRDKALSEHENYRAGVRAPMWDRFWAHLDYATRGLLAEEGHKGFPPGTRQRIETIPFAE